MMQVIYQLLKPNCFDKNKRALAKNILIMGKQAQTTELSTELGINYIPCCSIVLMCYNASRVSRSRARPTESDKRARFVIRVVRGLWPSG